jgi:adenylate kinase family enzyme
MPPASAPLAAQSPRRIIVAGVSGAGKTTLARRIGERLLLPHTEIDALFHGPDWTPRAEFAADVERLAASDEWVTEWQYAAARPVLAARAQLLVWLDLPYRVTFRRVVARTVRRARRGEELWNGNVEPGMAHAVFDREGVIRWSVATRNQYRRLVPEAQADHASLTVVRLRSQREADEWMSRLPDLRGGDA